MREWSRKKFGNAEEEVKRAKEEAVKWEEWAEQRELEEHELEKWMECRRRWLEKEHEQTEKLRMLKGTRTYGTFTR